MYQIARFKGANSFIMCCDFCATAEREEGVFLIASPNGTHICQNCVKACGELITAKGVEEYALSAVT